jgi:hypothetical protein
MISESPSRGWRWVAAVATLAAFGFLGLLLIPGAEGSLGSRLSPDALERLSLALLAGLLAAHLVFWSGRPEQGNLAIAGCGAVTGALLFVSLFGIRSVNPLETEWLRSNERPWTTSQQAWTQYQHGPWQFPVTAIDGAAEPEPDSILKADSIPLVAIGGRTLRGRLPEQWQYLGGWLLLSFGLQGAFAGLLMRCLTHSLGLQTLGIGLFLCSPILLRELPQPAASAHWIVLAGLWLNFRNWGTPPTSWAWLSWLALVLVSAWVQPYLMVISLGLAVAFGFRCVRLERFTPPATVGIWGAALALALGVSGWLLGYWNVGDHAGYLSQFRPGPARSLGLLAVLEPAGASAFLQSGSQATESNAAGFAYAGAGGLLLLAWGLCLLVQRPVEKGAARLWMPLAWMSLFFTVVAAIPFVSRGSHVLFDLSPFFGDRGLPLLLSDSVRYVWPAWYLSLYFLIALLVHIYDFRRAFPLLALALLLQGLDLRPEFAARQSELKARPHSTEARALSKPFRVVDSLSALPSATERPLVP